MQTPILQFSATSLLYAVIGICALSICARFLWSKLNALSLLTDKQLLALEARHPAYSILTLGTKTALSFGLAYLLFGKTIGQVAPFSLPSIEQWIPFAFIAAGSCSVVLQYRFPKCRPYAFAVVVGSILTFLLIHTKVLLLEKADGSPFTLAFGVVLVYLAWKSLFGPWKMETKATVLGTFVGWITLFMIAREDPSQRLAHVLAILISLIPAIIWGMLFLHEHKQRKAFVLLMFFAGMLSTAPILFYDALVRRGIELEFFLFRITPQSFSSSSSAFVSGNLANFTGLQSTLMASLISFIIVGLIEEVSKFWVLKNGGERFFESIDDVLQLGIIVAIGFAFAENVLNPTYVIGFIKQYLLGSSPDWAGFLGNLMGRAVLTNMVHILSTGVFAYFYALSLFAEPYMEDTREDGDGHVFAFFIHWLLRIPEKIVFKRQVMIMGFVSSVLLHGFFNFLVTLPDLLPGNPRTLGDILGSAPGSPLHYIALLVIPALFYVVGGFWLLSVLFSSKESLKEHGRIVRTETYVMSKYFQ